MDPDLDLISALPDAVKRRIHDHLARSTNALATKFESGKPYLPSTLRDPGNILVVACNPIV